MKRKLTLLAAVLWFVSIFTLLITLAILGNTVALGILFAIGMIIFLVVTCVAGLRIGKWFSNNG